MNCRILLWFFLFYLAASGPAMAQAGRAPGAVPGRTAAQMSADYNIHQRQPALCFVENKGQIKDQKGRVRTDLDFKLQGGNVSVFIGAGRLEYQWTLASDSQSVKVYRMDVSLQGSAPAAKILKEQGVTGKELFYTDGREIAAGSFRKIVYQNIYPNIDWVLYIEEGRKLKYDFVVHEGGHYGNIQLRYEGASGLSLDAQGSLHITTPAGTVTEKAPVSFVRSGHQQQLVGSRYLLEGNRLQYSVDPFKGTLVIDPEIEWATFLGGDTLGGNDPYATAVMNNVQKCVADNKGNVFVGGLTNAVDNIATTGAYLNTLQSNQDFFVMKFNNKGERIWGTYYYGGDAWSVYMGPLTTDHSGNVYFAGFGTMKYFENFSSAQAHQDTFRSSHVRLVKLGSEGQRLWATYYGGLQPVDAGNGSTIAAKNVVVDQDNNVFLIGETTEMNNFDYGNIYNIIATKGAHKEEHTYGDYNSKDIFIAKFDSAGQRLWGTYYGGLDEDLAGSGWYADNKGRNAVTDKEGNLYLVGYTRSKEGISTAGSYQENLTLDNQYNNDEDGFIAKFSPKGDLLWGTYYGGWNMDAFSALDLDTAGNLVIVGRTSSKDKIVSPGSFQDTLAYAFGYRQVNTLVKFDAQGNRIWGSYFNDPDDIGGNWGINFVDLAVDRQDNYWILLSTWHNSAFFKKGKQWSPHTDGSGNNILVQFRNDTIHWSSYINADFKSLSIDKFGSVYLAGAANAGSYVSPGAHQEDFISDYGTGYLMKANACDGPAMISPENLQPVSGHCPYAVVTFSVDPGFDAYKWVLPSGWTGASDSSSIRVQLNSQSGTIRVSGSYQCGESAERAAEVKVIEVTAIDFVTERDSLYAKGYESYAWYFEGKELADKGDHIFLGKNYGPYKLVAVTAEGCTVEAIYEHKEELSVAGQELLSVNIYPNPAASHIKVDWNRKAQYTVSDMAGKQLIRTVHNDIDISSLQAGVYVLQVHDAEGKGLKTVKFVKHAQ